MRRVAALLFLPLAVAVLFLPGGCRSHRQQGFPGSVYITRDYEFRVDRPYPAYRFWVVSDNRLQPLSVSRQSSAWVFGAMRQYGVGWVVAAPPGRVEEVVRTIGIDGLWMALLEGTPPPGILWSRPLDFGEGVSFTDSRDQIEAVYELQICLPDRVRLERVSETEPDWRVRRWWQLAGYSTLAGMVLAPVVVLRDVVSVYRGWRNPPVRRAIPVTPEPDQGAGGRP